MLRPLVLAIAFLLAGCVTPADSGATDTGASGSPAADPATRLALLQDAWLCRTHVEVDDLNTTEAGGLACRIEVEIADGYAVVTASGIPNHDFESGPGCCAVEVGHEWRIPVEPSPDTDGDREAPPVRGAIAVALNGVPIFGPEDGPGGDAVASHNGAYEEDRQPIWLGVCHGHAAGTTYHYHADANCIHWHPDEAAGEDWLDWSRGRLDAAEASPLIGFAFDGYPIYGPYATVDGAVVELASSYQLKSGATGYNGIADYEYVEGAGDLDACNGRFAATADFPNGTYHYVSTFTGREGALGYPYFIACYHGAAESSSYVGGGAPGGGPPRR